MKKIIASIIKKERKRAKLTQDKLAEEIEVSTRFIQMVEAGTERPGLLNLFKLCHALDLHYTVIFDPLWEHFKKKLLK